MMNAILFAALCSYWSANGPTVYNGQQGLDDAYANAIDTAGIGGFRMGFRIDGHATWDQALFDQYDALLAKAKAHGLEVLAIVLYESTPPSAGGQAEWNTGYDSSGMNAYVQTFASTAKTLMTRYGDRIKHWEIWNEPNAWTNSNYQTDPANAGGTYVVPIVYAKMLAETWVQNETLIASNGLHLVTGGLFAHDIGGGFSPGDSYMQAVYASGPWDWMQANKGRRYPWDAFGYHVYIDQGGATSSGHIAKYLDAIETAKTSASDGAPLWITEFGWQAPKNMTLADQASNIDVALTTFESRSDVARTFVFKLDDYDDWGIFNADFSAKPAVATFQKHDVGCTKPSPDAGTDAGADAGAIADAGADVEGDAGSNPPVGSGGCSCDASPRSGAPPFFAFVGLMLAFLRRRIRS